MEIPEIILAVIVAIHKNMHYDAHQMLPVTSAGQ
jgi:hypothetical protein